MAKKISELAAAAAPSGTELLELVQGGVNVKTLVGALLPPGTIDGLQLQWVSATALTVSSGAAYVPSLNRVLLATAAIAKTGLSLSASSWYHVYLWLNGVNPDMEIVTTGPAARYAGTAHTKAGDTSRRYLGSVLTNASGQLVNFLQVGNAIAYQAVTQNAPFRVLAGGTATAKTEVSTANVVPATGRLATLSCNVTSDVSVRLGNSNDGGAVGDAIYAFKAGAAVVVPMPLTATGTFNYGYSSAPTNGGGLIVDVTGYQFER